MEKTTITAVSYLNTLPFVYGLQQCLSSETHELMLAVPSECARKVLSAEVDFGLVPVAILPEIAGTYNLMDYGIAADHKVDSVLLLSQVPLSAIRSISLDKDSRTSVLLARILAQKLWRINPEWKDAQNIHVAEEAGGLLVIGDKAFGLRSQYLYCLDLAEEWNKMSGLPFVFAIWVSRKGLSRDRVETVSHALEYGTQNIADTVKAFPDRAVPGVNLLNYLTLNIGFPITTARMQGLQRFLELSNEIDYQTH